MADKKYESIPKTRQFSHSKYENKYANIYEINVRKDKSRVPKEIKCYFCTSHQTHKLILKKILGASSPVLTIFK